MQYKNSSGKYGDLYNRTQQLIDEFRAARPEEYKILDNLSFTDPDGNNIPVNIVIGVSDEKGPKNPETGNRDAAYTSYSFIPQITDCYDADNKHTQKFEITGIKDNIFTVTLFQRHHDLGTLANELGDVLFAVSRPETVYEERHLNYYNKATTLYSFHYEDYIVGKRGNRPDPYDKKKYM